MAQATLPQGQTIQVRIHSRSMSSLGTHVVSLEDFCEGMTEGEELICKEPLNGNQQWHFQKWKGELWFRVWDQWYNTYCWQRYSEWLASR